MADTLQDEFSLPSQEELAARKSFSALPSDNYIIKIGSVELEKGLAFGSKTEMTVNFKMIAMVYGLKAGGTMRDDKGDEVEPFSKYIYRNINPFAVGYQQDKVTPSFLRGLVSILNGVDSSAALKTPGFILLDPNQDVVTDPALRAQFIQETKSVDAPKTMIAKGYKAICDITGYLGRYIACDIERYKNDKGNWGNKITKFSRLPESFKVPSEEVETEALKKFSEFYEKQAKGKSGATSVKDQTSDDLGEVKIDDVFAG